MNIEENSDKSAAVIARAAELAARPTSTDADRREAVRMAYEIGLAEGRVLGGVEMRELFLAGIRGAA